MPSRTAIVHGTFLAALSLLFALAPFTVGASGRVVLIGVDGGSWNLLDPGIQSGELPHLAALIARGVSADLDTVEPVISPTVWTNIATGRTPEAHGVRGFSSDSNRAKVPSVFERLAAQGMRIGLYDD